MAFYEIFPIRYFLCVPLDFFVPLCVNSLLHGESTKFIFIRLILRTTGQVNSKQSINEPVIESSKFSAQNELDALTKYLNGVG